MGESNRSVREDKIARDDARRARTAGACLAALAVALLAIWWILSLRVTVPDVVGQRVDDAVAIVESAGLSVREVVRVPRGVQGPGEVVAQCPEAGVRLFSWQTVRLIALVGDGAAADDEAELPDEDGIVLTWGERRPAAEERQARPPGPPTVPQLFNMTQTQAVAELRRSGYRWAVEHGPSSTDVKAGRVFFQDPPPHTVAERGTVVTIRLSTGPPPLVPGVPGE